MPAPPGFEEMLNNKYAQQQQQISSESNLRAAQAAAIPIDTQSQAQLRAATANETNMRASTLQPLAQASIAGTMGGVGEAAARANYYNTEARTANVNIGKDLSGYNDTILGHVHGLMYPNKPQGQSAPAGQYSAQTPDPNSFGAPDAGQGTSVLGYGGQSLGGGTLQPGAYSKTGKISLEGGDDGADQPYGPAASHLSKGTTKVPGKTPPKNAATTDTVPAMLTPGEAVLNKHAAELVGRDKIQAINRAGLAVKAGKGMPASKGPVKKFADGTADVPERMVTPPIVASSGSTVTLGYGGGPMNRVQDPDGHQTYLRQGMTLDQFDKSTENMRKAVRGRDDAINNAPKMMGRYADGVASVPSLWTAAQTQNPQPNTGITTMAPVSKAAGSQSGKIEESPRKYAKGTARVPDAFYTKKGLAPLKPQTLANGSHNVMPGKSAKTGPAPKGLTAALAAMQAMQAQQPQTGAQPLAPTPPSALGGRGMV